MQLKLKTVGVAVAATMLSTVCAAQNLVNTYTGSDDGGSTSGPWANSAAAEAAFAAAASSYGSLQTLTFEAQAVGMAGFSEGNAAVTMSGPNYGNGFSGISDTTYGNLYGFNVTTGGSHWLGTPLGSTTITFAGGTNAFGAYFTGLQTSFSGTSRMVITFNDGTTQTLNVPTNVNGGVSYIGFTDTSSFTSVTISNTSNDAWGIDNVSFAVSSVPEPTSMALMLAGLAVVGGARRRAARKAA